MENGTILLISAVVVSSAVQIYTALHSLRETKEMERDLHEWKKRMESINDDVNGQDS